VPAPRHPPYVALAGPSAASPEELRAAEQVGRALARAGAVLLTGGLGGAMEAACRGAAEAGGLTVGILPGAERAAANPHVAVAIATGLGELRNGLLVRAADALIAVGGGYGTLSEIALALRAGVPVIGLGSWQIDGVERASSPAEAVGRALGRLGERAGRA
jgi:uncharacterized protein (TIGR00725 family)